MDSPSFPIYRLLAQDTMMHYDDWRSGFLTHSGRLCERIPSLMDSSGGRGKCISLRKGQVRRRIHEQGWKDLDQQNLIAYATIVFPAGSSVGLKYRCNWLLAWAIFWSRGRIPKNVLACDLTATTGFDAWCCTLRVKW